MSSLGWLTLGVFGLLAVLATTGNIWLHFTLRARHVSVPRLLPGMTFAWYLRNATPGAPAHLKRVALIVEILSWAGILTALVLGPFAWN